MSPDTPAHRVLLLWGEDAYLLRDAAHEALGEVSPVELDAAEWRGGETADLATPSLFGEPRALLVTDCRSLREDAVRELTAYLAAPAPEARLILCFTVSERGKPPAAVTKLVQVTGEIREVKVSRKDLPAWVARRARTRGVDIAPDGSQALVDVVGEDPAALEQALEQLAAAFPGQRMTRELVSRQFRGLGDQHVWDLCDRAFGKDLAGAIRSLRVLLERRDGEGLMILGGIASRLRDLMRVRDLPDRMPAAQVAKAAGLRFEWQGRRYREQARRFTARELAALHGRIADADRRLKSGASEDVMLPILVSAIAGGGVSD